MKQKVIDLFRAELLQSFWEKLHHWSKIGMNYWGGAAWQQSGELIAFDKVLEKLTEPIVIFDVGANNGHYARAICNLIETTNKKYICHCFEPVSSTFVLLCETFNTNESFVLNNFGLGETESKVEVIVPSAGSVLSSAYQGHFENGSVFRDHLKEGLYNQKLKEFIEIRTLDFYCTKMAVSKIDFLKIDVEGFELNVLKGGQKTLAQDKILAIQFEFGECMIDARVFFRDFWNLLHEKYKIYRILPNGVREIKLYSEGLEIFHCVNFLAIHKLLQ